jgi:hypothetical protein
MKILITIIALFVTASAYADECSDARLKIEQYKVASQENLAGSAKEIVKGCDDRAERERRKQEEDRADHRHTVEECNNARLTIMHNIVENGQNERAGQIVGECD